MGLYVNVRVKALIFDIDGTLADTMPFHLQAWEKAGKTHGFAFPPELFFRYAGLPTREIVRKLNQQFEYNLDPDQVTAVKNANYLKLAKEIQPIEPVLTVVRQFYGRLPMGLGTGEVRSLAEQNIKMLGLEKYFSVMVCCEDVKNPKPDPETFLRCADRLGIAPEYCQVFEDSESGLEAARKAGMIATDIRPYLQTVAPEPEAIAARKIS